MSYILILQLEPFLAYFESRDIAEVVCKFFWELARKVKKSSKRWQISCVDRSRFLSDNPSLTSFDKPEYHERPAANSPVYNAIGLLAKHWITFVERSDRREKEI